jgi:hypothetical protein
MGACGPAAGGADDDDDVNPTQSSDVDRRRASTRSRRAPNPVPRDLRQRRRRRLRQHRRLRRRRLLGQRGLLEPELRHAGDVPQGIAGAARRRVPEDETQPVRGLRELAQLHGLQPGPDAERHQQAARRVREHGALVDARPRRLRCECPNGTRVMLSDFEGQMGSVRCSSASPTASTAGLPVPGTGWDYCWTPTATDQPWIPYANAHPVEHAALGRLPGVAVARRVRRLPAQRQLDDPRRGPLGHRQRLHLQLVGALRSEHRRGLRELAGLIAR